MVFCLPAFCCRLLSVGMVFLRVIVSWIYGLVVSVRNMLFDEHILMSYKPSLPTVCIGNLAMGGTGKTPHTEYLARELSRHYRVAILSRGYKRKTIGFLLADDSSTAFTIGDEPMQMHLNLPDVPVAVCENRIMGIRRLQRLIPDLQLVLLDDAYQHRRLTCGFYLLLTAADNLYVNDRFFPIGHLRESKHGSLRANMIVVTKCSEKMKPIDRRLIETSLHILPYQTLCFSYLKYGELQPLLTYGRCEGADAAQVEIVNDKPLVVTGIENPHPMIDYLQSLGKRVLSLSYSDHHQFTKADYQKILEMYKAEKCTCIITTQKDAVRMLVSKALPDEIRNNTLVLPVEIDFKGQDLSFLKPVMQYVKENNKKK